LIEHATGLEGPVVELVCELLLFLGADRFGSEWLLRHKTYATLDALDHRGVVLGTALETPHGCHVVQSRISKRERVLAEADRHHLFAL
jgi:hypothetical protein